MDFVHIFQKQLSCFFIIQLNFENELANSNSSMIWLCNIIEHNSELVFPPKIFFSNHNNNRTNSISQKMFFEVAWFQKRTLRYINCWKSSFFVPFLCNQPRYKWYFITKIVLTYCEKKNVLVIEKFEAEGREFSKFLRSLEQFIQTVKGQNKFW